MFAQAQDARVGNYNTAPAPITCYNPMDLRQGYVAFIHERKWGAQFRAGRQEMAFSCERLIGPSDWGMSRTFDALDLSLTHGRAGLDLFAGSAPTTPVSATATSSVGARATATTRH